MNTITFIAVYLSYVRYFLYRSHVNYVFFPFCSQYVISESLIHRLQFVMLSDKTGISNDNRTRLPQPIRDTTDIVN